MQVALCEVKPLDGVLAQSSLNPGRVHSYLLFTNVCAMHNGVRVVPHNVVYMPTA